MKKKMRRDFLKGVPVWLQALMLAMVALLLLFILAGIAGMITVFSADYGEQAGYLFHAVFIAAGCFYICRRHPKSLWYVLLIANVFVFVSAIIEPTFWTTSLWIFLGCSLPLSVIAAFFGAQKAKLR